MNAVDRPIVRLADGRTARLIYWPGPKGRHSHTHATVVLPSGAYLSVPTDQIEPG